MEIRNIMIVSFVVLVIFVVFFTLRHTTSGEIEKFVSTDICAFNSQKPTINKHVSITNVIHFAKKMKKKHKLLAVAAGKTDYLFLTKQGSEISSLNDSVIRNIICEDDGVYSLVEHMIKHLYEPNDSNFMLEKMNTSTMKRRLNQTCNSYDFNDNVLVDFVNEQGINDVLIVRFNSIFDENFYSFLKDSMLNTHLQMIPMFDGNADDQSMFTKKIHWYLFNATHDQFKILTMDDLICVKHNHDNKKFIRKWLQDGLVNVNKTQLYIDLFHCNSPPDALESEMKLLMLSQAQSNQKKTRQPINSCEDDTIVSNYVNFRCSKNHFIDVYFPFAHPYVISLSEHDFSTLIVHGDTFDGIIPINSLLTRNKENFTRYKINVDKSSYPREHFIDDIYYGVDEDASTKHVVLTNSIPFTFDSDKHNFKKTTNSELDESIEYYIYNKNFTDVTTHYITNKEKVNDIKLMANDRIFVDPNTIPSGEMEVTLNNLFTFEDINMYHGNVEINKYLKDDDGNIFDALVIRLFEIRKNKTHPDDGTCFDSDYNMISADSSVVQTKNACEKNKGHTWDTPCKYNYQCPFFQANKNYPNVFGGCNDNGYCEMPKGIIKQSFRKYDKLSQPVCNNCDKIKDSSCCVSQSGPESNLKSPDYMFESDFLSRKQAFMINSNEFCSKNSNHKKMMINKYI